MLLLTVGTGVVELTTAVVVAVEIWLELVKGVDSDDSAVLLENDAVVEELSPVGAVLRAEVVELTKAADDDSGAAVELPNGVDTVTDVELANGVDTGADVVLTNDDDSGAEVELANGDDDGDNEVDGKLTNDVRAAVVEFINEILVGSVEIGADVELENNVVSAVVEFMAGGNSVVVELAKPVVNGADVELAKVIGLEIEVL